LTHLGTPGGDHLVDYAAGSNEIGQDLHASPLYLDVRHPGIKNSPQPNIVRLTAVQATRHRPPVKIHTPELQQPPQQLSLFVIIQRRHALTPESVTRI
jgi:hypothetical protein